jgi:gag-polypeptide of LTR copia-type
MQSYLDQKRSLVDRLRLVGSPVSDADLQLYILHRLNIDYDSLVVSFNFRSDLVPFNELTKLLLTHEQRLHKHALTSCVSSSSSVPLTLTTTTSAASLQLQANLSSSSLLGAPPTSEIDLLAQFTSFLSSKGSWRGKSSDRSGHALSDQFLC